MLSLRPTLALAGFTVALLAGCSSSTGEADLTTTGDSGGASSSSVSVKATDDSCELSTDTVAAGSTTLKVTNAGSETTEVYVYDGETVVGEKENIGPGIDVSFSVDLDAGDYEVACKPGERGDGIRSTLHAE